MTKYEIGYFQETEDGRMFCSLKQIKRDTDAEAEAEVDGLFQSTPVDEDGFARAGLYVKRGRIKWFRRFSHHLIMSHPKRAVAG